MVVYNFIRFVIIFAKNFPIFVGLLGNYDFNGLFEASCNELWRLDCVFLNNRGGKGSSIAEFGRTVFGLDIE